MYAYLYSCIEIVKRQKNKTIIISILQHITKLYTIPKDSKEAFKDNFIICNLEKFENELYVDRTYKFISQFSCAKYSEGANALLHK